MQNRSFIFPKGEYYFGDLGYVIPEKDWFDIFVPNEEGDWDYKNKEYLLFRTGADGYFFNERLSNDFDDNFPVDSGTLGLIPTDLIEPKTLENLDGIIFKSTKSDIKIVVQGDRDLIYGIHIFQDKKKYYFNDQAILVVIDDNLIDEEYFYSRCPEFSLEDKTKELFVLNRNEDEDEDGDNEEYVINFDNKSWSYHEDHYAFLVYKRGVLESFLDKCNNLFIENYKRGAIAIKEGNEIGTLTMTLDQVNDLTKDEFNTLEGKELFDFYGLPIDLLGKEEYLSWCDG